MATLGPVHLFPPPALPQTLAGSHRSVVLQVPFQDALDLVRNRRAYLKAGYVYIPHQDIVITVLNDFRTQLSKSLAVSGPAPRRAVR